MDAAKIDQRITSALEALERLEQALHDGNHRMIGAEMGILRHELEAIRQETQPGKPVGKP